MRWIPPITTIQEEHLLIHVARKSLLTTSPLNMTALWKDYNHPSGMEKSICSLSNHFLNEISPKLHELSNFSMATKIRMLFATKTVVEKGFLEEIRQVADELEVDEQGVIVRYKRGELELRDALEIAPEDLEDVVPAKRRRMSHQEEVEELPDIEPKTSNEKMLIDVLRALRRIARYLDSPILESFQKKVDNSIRNCSKSKMSHPYFPTRCQYTPEEDRAILEHLHLTSLSTNEPLTAKALWGPLRKKGDARCRRTTGSIRSHFTHVLAPKLHTFKEFDLEAVIKMLFVSGSQVNYELLKAVKRRADYLEVNEKWAIVKLKIGDFELNAPGAVGMVVDCSDEPEPEPEKEPEEQEDGEVIEVKKEIEELVEVKSEQSDYQLILNGFLKMTISLSSPRLVGIQKRIENSLENFEDKLIPLKITELTLSNFFAAAHFPIGAIFETVSLRKVLELLLEIVVDLRLADLRNQVEGAIESSGEQQIPVGNVLLAIEMVYTLLTQCNYY